MEQRIIRSICLTRTLLNPESGTIRIGVPTMLCTGTTIDDLKSYLAPLIPNGWRFLSSSEDSVEYFASRAEHSAEHPAEPEPEPESKPAPPESESQESVYFKDIILSEYFFLLFNHKTLYQKVLDERGNVSVLKVHSGLIETPFDGKVKCRVVNVTRTIAEK